MNTLKLLLLLFSLAFLSACTQDEIQAEKSMLGIWNVTEIRSIYGFASSEIITEQGSLGFFHFEEDLVDFSFTRNDTLYRGNATWHVNAEKVRSGFVRETIFRLTIEDEFIFDIQFEDGTNNSEKNAQNAAFSNESIITENETLLVFQLEKE